MKKIILFFALTSISTISLIAQQDSLKNGSFEKWSVISGAYEDPDFFYSLNFLVQFGFDETTLKSTDAHSGSFAAKLVSKSSSFGAIPGLLCSNFMFDQNGNPVFEKNLIPFNSRPIALEFYFKYFPQVGDSALSQIVLTKWNSTLSKRDTIGLANWAFADSVNSYTKAWLKFNYLSTEIPDSMGFIFVSSFDGFNPIVGSILFLDDLQFTYNGVGLNEITDQEKIIVYPNPAKDFIQIINSNENSILRIYDLTGKLCVEQKRINEQTKFKLENLNEGIYFVVITDKKNEIKLNQKLVIIK